MCIHCRSKWKLPCTISLLTLATCTLPTVRTSIAKWHDSATFAPSPRHTKLREKFRTGKVVGEQGFPAAEACQNQTNNDSFDLGRTLKMNGRSPFERKVWHNKDRMCSSFKCLCHFPGNVIPCSVCFARARTIPYFLVLVHKNTETPLLIYPELLRVFGNLCCVCKTLLLIFFVHHSLSLIIHMPLILP